MKKNILHGIIAGSLAAVAGITYQMVYENALFLDFSSVINPGSIAGTSFFGCMLMALGYWLLVRINKPILKGWLNVLIAALSFLSILGPLSMSLPLNIEFPEMFPGLAIPMHFFPALMFFGLFPFFTNSTFDEPSKKLV
tara:strand:- start:513 stop:929 length:417 start_codon:yes stop_codon:yes gene_type:complete